MFKAFSEAYELYESEIEKLLLKLEQEDLKHRYWTKW